MTFFTLWKNGYLNPSLTWQALKSKTGPYYGLAGVIFCWLGRDLLIIVPWYFMGIEPWQPSYISFLTPENYYFWEMLFLPDFGLLIWLTGSALLYLFLRIVEWPVAFDQVLNLTGITALIIAPIGIVLDWMVCWFELRTVLVMGCLHSGLALWSLLLVAFGLWHMFGVQKKYGWLLALLVTAVNILVAAIVVR